MSNDYMNNLINSTLRAFIGSDGLLDELNFVKNCDKRFIDSNYPPCDIIRRFDDSEHKHITGYTLKFALAGYTKENIRIQELEDKGKRYLHIDNTSNKKELENNIEYLKKGISSKNFSVDFLLSDELKINSAVMRNGLLIIDINVKEINTNSCRCIEID